jgi:hypothetical protein
VHCRIAGPARLSFCGWCRKALRVRRFVAVRAERHELVEKLFLNVRVCQVMDMLGGPLAAAFAKMCQRKPPIDFVALARALSLRRRRVCFPPVASEYSELGGSRRVPVETGADCRLSSCCFSALEDLLAPRLPLRGCEVCMVCFPPVFPEFLNALPLFRLAR